MEKHTLTNVGMGVTASLTVAVVGFLLLRAGPLDATVTPAAVVVPECGNGAAEAGETCDDGNTMLGDGCHRCQIEAGWLCGGSPSRCEEGAPQGVCGDGQLGALESCDDGNFSAGDGCDTYCRVEVGWLCDAEAPSDCRMAAGCGNGAIDAEESCDDGNHFNGDGCSMVCRHEDGFDCVGQPSRCEAKSSSSSSSSSSESSASSEESSSAAAFSAQSSSVSSESAPPEAAEPKAESSSAESSAFSRFRPRDREAARQQQEAESAGVVYDYSEGKPTCGDGVILNGEQCDDGDESSGDGCSASCTVEQGWLCVGEPSNCALTCGNGVETENEACDDGNHRNGDGCTEQCLVEAGWECDESAPNVCRDVTPDN